MGGHHTKEPECEVKPAASAEDAERRRAEQAG